MWLHILQCDDVCSCTYWLNDVQHVIGFSWLKRDDGVQRRYQAVAEKGTRHNNWVEIKTDTLPLRLGDWLFCREEVKAIGHLGSWHSLMGAGSWLLSGRKLKNSRTLSKASTSFSNAQWATPENDTRNTWDTFQILKTIFQLQSLWIGQPISGELLYRLYVDVTSNPGSAFIHSKLLETWPLGRYCDRARGKMPVKRASGCYSWTLHDNSTLRLILEVEAFNKTQLLQQWKQENQEQ